MSDGSSTQPMSSGGIFESAKSTAASAAERIRQSAPGAFEAGASATTYVTETARAYPGSTLMITAALE